ncbi:amidohydrolase family protein [Streptosporangium sp. NPDC006930]|uniref:amidohydrolase family protein n=1 Tax=unclassified Streptosporangium TaxID=2632669 RepID=UPI00343332FB
MTTGKPRPLISVDSHVVEPKDLWLKRLPQRFQHQAPQVQSTDKGDFFIVPNTGMSPKPVGTEGAMINTKINSVITKPTGYRFEDQRPGAYDPVARLEDQDSQGILAEIVYPGWLIVHSIPDFELKVACVRAYNDWLFEEFCSHNPDRLIGAVALPVGPGPVEPAIEEARRWAERGAKTFLLPQAVPGMAWGDDHWEPLWSVLEEIGLPVGFHQAAGQVAMFNDKTTPGVFWTTAVGNKISLGWVFMQLVYGAVPERHPNLRFILVEGGIGWIAFQLNTMDHLFTDHHRWTIPELAMKPSDYFNRNFWATFEDDRPGILTLPMLDEKRLMWAGDYPHTEGNFPYSQEQVAHDFQGIEESVVSAITHDNAIDLFGLSLPRLVKA